MVLTESTMAQLTTTAPDFTLYDVISQKKLSLKELKSDVATVIMFICNHCPFVIHIREGLVKLANEYQAKGIQFIAISSNDPDNYPDDAPDKLREVALEQKYPFPFLFDETQQVAKAYQAACTPDFFIYDQNLELVYRGRFDDSRPSKQEIPVTGKDIRAALDNLLAGEPVPTVQKPSIGCNIKWRG